ncbi:TonB-dependent receptor plug domain-containing protein [Desulfosarcina ovata]|uniref:Vitamin B12 transporter BtuB n=1 Tax=Desulfosarcina ovata subsp. ovata TaxID=2752305 RepID=A0A5K8AID6_9BACT|nr:TonB-dependent receptor [Desulfosarcina ovata]BBO92443.1 vitamin B12 transporter BtuB [Desulfosarcina ovata subsp. ovata]
MIRSLLICLVVMLIQPIDIFADEQTPSDDEAQSSITDRRSPITENGDTIVITAEEIGAMQAHKMADVLNHVPGVTAGDSSVGIHGVYKVKVFVDGRPINDPTSSYGAIKWDLILPDQVERIEILRGKGSSRYGQDASGGVILITTKRTRDLTGNVKTYAGNHGTGYGHANLQMTTGSWTAGVTGGFEATDGYKVNNDKERWKAGASAIYTIDDGKNFSFSADYIEDERGSSGQPDYPTPFSRKETENTSLSFRATWRPVASTTYYNEGRNHNTDPSRSIDKTLRVSKWGEDLSATFSTGDWGELNAGGAFQMDRASGSNFDDQQEETYSLFAVETLHRMDGRLSLTAGLRANINSAFDDALNPEIKLSYKWKKWRATVAYSRSSNTPSFYQRYNETSSTRPNPSLTMETSDNYSLSLFGQLYRTLSGSVSIFHNRLTDRITYVTGDDGIGQYQNFGLVTYTGGDFAATWTPHDTIKVKTTYTYMEAVDEETDHWLTSKARHTVNLDFYWQPIQPVSIVLTNKYVSKVYRNTSNTKTAPEYTLTGLRAEYAFQRFSLFTDIENLFDKTYYYADGLLAPPLCWVVGVNWRI